MQEQIYVGLDMGSSLCQQAVIDSSGTLRFSRIVPTSEQHLRSAFEGLEGEVSVHLEAGELSAWAAGIIGPLVKRVVVSHPRTLAWIARDPLKTDKRDAAKLAELLRLGRVHEVYQETDNKRQTFKHLVVHYEMMSREQARQKSKIKARLRTLGIIRKDTRVFGEAGQSELFEAIKEPSIYKEDDRTDVCRIESDDRYAGRGKKGDALGGQTVSGGRAFRGCSGCRPDHGVPLCRLCSDTKAVLQQA